MIFTFFLNSLFITLLPLIIIWICAALLILHLISLRKSRRRLDRSGNLSNQFQEKTALIKKLVLIIGILVSISGFLGVIFIIARLNEPSFNLQAETNQFIQILLEVNDLWLVMEKSVRFLLYCSSSNEYRNLIKRACSFQRQADSKLQINSLQIKSHGQSNI